MHYNLPSITINIFIFCVTRSTHRENKQHPTEIYQQTSSLLDGMKSTIMKVSLNETHHGNERLENNFRTGSDSYTE